MARQTRQQRRARRQAQGDSGASAAPRARARAQQIRPAAQPQKSQTGSRPVPGRETRRFLSESWGELKKVEWPSQGQVIQGTTVVLIACIIVGLYLYANDQVWKRFVEHVLLH